MEFVQHVWPHIVEESVASRIKEDTLSRRRKRDRLRREMETPEERDARFKSRRNKPYIHVY